MNYLNYAQSYVSFKVPKLDACIRPFFTNPVTYIKLDRCFYIMGQAFVKYDDMYACIVNIIHAVYIQN